jgi:Arc/MetJ family transcription regulator
MGTHMKTTIEISDTLLRDAKRIAGRDGVTLRTLVESGLRQELEQRRRGREFRMRRASFKGKGLQPGARPLSWDQLRDLAYSGRGS